MTIPLPYGQPDPWGALDDGLRWYQREMALAAQKELETHRSTLIVAATGLGKTETFAAIAADWQGNVLVLCHRDELIDQARGRVEKKTGEWVQREKGMWRADMGTRLVVASIDTLRQQKRLERFAPDHFSLIIIDEAHHYVGNSYTKPLQYFKTAKIVGVTATPDRADEKALGMVFDSVAYRMDILEGIDTGYLVPIKASLVHVDEIDISMVGKTGKDLAVGQLDAAIVKAVEVVVRETIRLEPDRQGICFFPGVKSAEYAAEKFNLLRPGSACFLSGQTPPDQRQQMVRAFRRGEFRYLCNCQVATEGFDAPGVSLIVIARPTLSRSLHAQMVGRGTRPLPGLVDRYPQKEAAVVRREAIRVSNKPDLMVLDFVGNCGKHDLASAVDALAGRYTEAEVKVAKKKLATSGGDPREALEAARKELLEIAAATNAKVKTTVQAFDPFQTLRIERPGVLDTGSRRKPMAPRQRSFLKQAGVLDEALMGMKWHDAEKLVRGIRRRRILGLCTLNQLRTLSRYGITNPDLSYRRAETALDYIAENNWNSRKLDPRILDRIANWREPGQEG